MAKPRNVRIMASCLLIGVAAIGYKILLTHEQGKECQKLQAKAEAERPAARGDALQDTGRSMALSATERARLLRERLLDANRTRILGPAVNYEPRTIELSPEEHSYLADLRRRTDSVYFELAPAVLENMWQEGAENIEWSFVVERHVNALKDDVRARGADFEFLGCRGRLCKVRTASMDGEASDRFSDLWATDGVAAASHLHSHAEKVDGDQTKFTLYFAHPDDFWSFVEVRERIAEMGRGTAAVGETVATAG